MGGKRSSGTSTTTPTIPPWLQGIIQPLLAGTAGKMSTLQDQGWNVLQGNPELNSSVTLDQLPVATNPNANPYTGDPRLK